MSNYWDEVVPEILGDLDIELSEDKLRELIESIKGAEETKGLYTGSDVANSNLVAHREFELKQLKMELELEKSKRSCPDCGGKGSSTVYSPSGFHRSSMDCHRCRGTGKVLPGE